MTFGVVQGALVLALGLLEMEMVPQWDRRRGIPVIVGQWARKYMDMVTCHVAYTRYAS
jgi:hypothetical protein